MSWLGALITFQVTFTELFIAASVIAAASYRFGWRSVVLGLALGVVAVATLAGILQVAAYTVALQWLDWLSALLLLGFGLYLGYEFYGGIGQRAESIASKGRLGWGLPVNAAGVGVAAWALCAEGLEILVVWLGVSLRQGAATATLGVALGLAVIGLIAGIMRGTGAFRRVPPYVLDGIAAVMVTAYGLYFLRLAWIGSTV